MTNPIVRVTNLSTQEVCIERDPNWDDQVLTIDGARTHHTLCLSPGVDANVSIDANGDASTDPNLMGVIFSDGKDVTYGNAGGYQTTIGHDADSGLLAVTDEFKLRSPSIQYSLGNQTQWSMDMTFADV
ncbi:MAG TPA: hypothetical protein VHC91_10640 [Trinickia sp.]|uniref:hypothetical protein n=1 Tax=Trinickia sp. TaxID=2571163 RepID=UPI002BB2BF4E|nr:hypothetical protein [Trinickia sp.]HVW50835.1 hypothetical protein [Trinickia sp.]